MKNNPKNDKSFYEIWGCRGCQSCCKILFNTKRSQILVLNDIWILLINGLLGIFKGVTASGLLL